MKRFLVPLGLAFALGLSSCPNTLQIESERTPEPTSESNSNSLPPSFIQSIPAEDNDSDAIISPYEKGAEASSQAESSSLNEALSEFLKKSNRTLQNTDFHSAYIDLNGDRLDEVLILLTDSYWCGSGGCHLVVFEGTEDGYQLTSKMPLVRAPVWVSETKSNGWNDLIVPVSGGGLSSRNVVLNFNGKTYPLNPSVAEVITSYPPLKAELFVANRHNSDGLSEDSKASSPLIGEIDYQATCSNWPQILSFETDNYWAYICENSNSLIYIGTEKSNSSNWIRLENVTIDNSTYRAQNHNTTYAVNSESLMVFQNGEMIASEPVLNVYNPARIDSVQ